MLKEIRCKYCTLKTSEDTCSYNKMLQKTP